MNQKSITAIITGLTILLNEGCASRGKVEINGEYCNNSEKREQKIRYETKNDGILRLKNDAHNGIRERIEVFAPNENEWIKLKQKSGPNWANFRYSELVKLSKKHKNLEFYHIHLYVSGISNERKINKVLPSKNDLKILGPGLEVKLGVISEYGVTEYKFRRERKKIIMFKIIDGKKEKEAIKEYDSRIEKIVRDPNIDRVRFLNEGFYLITDKIEVEFKPISEFMK